MHKHKIGLAAAVVAVLLTASTALAAKPNSSFSLRPALPSAQFADATAASEPSLRRPGHIRRGHDPDRAAVRERPLLPGPDVRLRRLARLLRRLLHRTALHALLDRVDRRSGGLHRHALHVDRGRRRVEHDRDERTVRVEGPSERPNDPANDQRPRRAPGPLGGSLRDRSELRDGDRRVVARRRSTCRALTAHARTSRSGPGSWTRGSLRQNTVVVGEVIRNRGVVRRRGLWRGATDAWSLPGAYKQPRGAVRLAVCHACRRA